MMDLPELAAYLSRHPSVAEKAVIHEAFPYSPRGSARVRLGDDCAAIPNPTGTGHLLFAAEGMLESFIEEDPWFAGYSAVMVSLTDIAAMGGRPLALTDFTWTPADEVSSQIWDGMQEAARAYGVAIAGGHTCQAGSGRVALGAAVLGHAAGERLITSFDAKPGDHLIIAVDMHGSYRSNEPYWNSSTTSSPERLRAGLEMLPTLVEKGLCCAGRGISHDGIIGTLVRLCQCSGVGAILDLEDLPCPMDVEIERWLVSSPSYGFLLAISPDDVESTLSHFTNTRITCRQIGRFKEASGITLTADGAAVDLFLETPRPRPVTEVYPETRQAV
jgi:uncharacterized protein